MKAIVTYADNLNLSEDEKVLAQNYIAELERKYASSDSLEVTVLLDENGNIAIDHTAKGSRFERIRRITGYLVGTIDRWNNAKRAECFDRVSHSLV